MRALHSSILAAVLAPAASFLFAQQPSLTIVVSNELDRPRPLETVELASAQLRPTFGAAELGHIHVTEADTARELPAQAVDLDGDGVADQLVFQAGFEPKAARRFTLTLGERPVLRKDDFRVYGRFVRERFDDFAWENDLVAHRVYGPALETWEKEPLTSSGVDVWVKSTRALVINDWYMVDDYHRDRGQGGDFYSVGPSRGCGGSGIWRDGRLHVSRNFRHSRVLANGPLRLVFELEYEPWDAGGVRVSERKRVTLDAGSRFNHVESTYEVSGASEVKWAAGIKKAKGSEVRLQMERGSLRSWEPLKQPNGNLGCAVIVAPANVEASAEVEGNSLLVGLVVPPRPVSTWVGSAWDKGGDITSSSIWDQVIEDQALRLASPLSVTLLPH